MSNGKPQCELRHLAFCNWDSIARARSRAGLPTSASQRACVWPMLRIPPCFQERPENLLILQFHLQNASRTAWRAGGPNIERSVRLIGCRNALSNVHRPKLLAEMGNLFPGKCALVLCCRRIDRHACLVPRAPLLHRKWPLVSVLINAGMKLRRHHLRRTEGRTGAGGGRRAQVVGRSVVFDARFCVTVYPQTCSLGNRFRDRQEHTNT